MRRLFVAVIIFSAILLPLLGADNEKDEEPSSSHILKKLLDSPKISPELKQMLKDDCPSISFIIVFYGSNCDTLSAFLADPIHALLDALRGDIIANLVHRLMALAYEIFGPVVDFLNKNGISNTPLWMEIEVFAENVPCSLIAQILQLPNVRLIRTVQIIETPKPVPGPDPGPPPVNPGGTPVPWPIQHVRGRCSEITCLGEGVVVAIIDTGVYAEHDELRGKMRAELNWYNPHKFTTEVFDSSDHGTHVMGIILGETVGIAPRAKFIACLALNGGSGSEVVVKLCMEWALCPHDATADTPEKRNSTKNCHMAPDIINNSWGGPVGDIFAFLVYYRSIQAWIAAGILHTFSAGNRGFHCTSIGRPAVYDISFTIGNTNINFSIESSSSRGPAPYPKKEMEMKSCNVNAGTCRNRCGGGGLVGGLLGGELICTLIKPNVAAPGTDINSCVPGSPKSYEKLTGTSMAAPLVAGGMALMVCPLKPKPNPKVVGPGGKNFTQVDAVDIIQRSAYTDKIDLANGDSSSQLFPQARVSHKMCNVLIDNCNPYPNNDYGFGIPDFCQAVKLTKKFMGLNAAGEDG